MDIWKDCPQILIHKLFLTLLIGVGCIAATVTEEGVVLSW